MQITTDDVWDCSCDIEISFPGLSFDELVELSAKLPQLKYLVSDKTDQGWGCVIELRDCWSGDRREVSLLIVDFLASVQALVNDVAQSLTGKPILRLGIYHETFSFTLQLDSSALASISVCGAELMVSLYPAE